MTVIRIHTRIDSETLHLPELRPLIGKEVEIVVSEQPDQPADRWQALREIVGEDLVDPEVYKRQREFDILHGQPPEL